MRQHNVPVLSIWILKDLNKFVGEEIFSFTDVSVAHQEMTLNLLLQVVQQDV